MAAQDEEDEIGADLKPETLLANLGREPEVYFGFVNTPVFRGSTVLFPNAEQLLSQDAEFTYGRPFTPTSKALADSIRELEVGARTFLAPSGLSAIAATLLAFANEKSHVLITDSAYFPTRRFADRVLARLGVEVEYYDPLIGADIATVLRANTALIWTEAPGSLSFEMQDIPAIAKAGAEAGVPVAMDNTWATPLYFKPLDHGVNISVLSATKYIVGHADALLGAITCDAMTAAHVARTHEALGLCASSDDCFLALRGLRTLAVRLERHGRSALALAEWLSGRPEVAKVLHPALPGAPGHEIWRRDFSGASGLFSIILKPYATEQVNRMLNALKLFGMGYSWGGYESLIIPFDLSRMRTARPWPEMGPGLRLHIGLEDPEDLKADLSRALDKLGE